MRRIKTLIIDDEQLAREAIKSHLSTIEEIDLLGECKDGFEGLKKINELKPDLIFLDIQMPKLTGLSMLKMMKNRPLTVLTTAHRNYALEGFDLDVVDFLLKPISFERFLQSVQKIKRLLDNKSANESGEAHAHIFIKENRNFIKLLFADIQFVEAIKNHVRITTTNQSHISLVNISSFEEQLPAEMFLRVHRSFIINLQHIDSFNANNITIGKQIIPIGRSYKDKIKTSLIDQIK